MHEADFLERVNEYLIYKLEHWILTLPTSSYDVNVLKTFVNCIIKENKESIDTPRGKHGVSYRQIREKYERIQEAERGKDKLAP